MTSSDALILQARHRVRPTFDCETGAYQAQRLLKKCNHTPMQKIAVNAHFPQLATLIGRCTIASITCMSSANTEAHTWSNAVARERCSGRSQDMSSACSHRMAGLPLRVVSQGDEELRSASSTRPRYHPSLDEWVARAIFFRSSRLSSHGSRRKALRKRIRLKQVVSGVRTKPTRAVVRYFTWTPPASPTARNEPCNKAYGGPHRPPFHVSGHLSSAQWAGRGSAR